MSYPENHGKKWTAEETRELELWWKTVGCLYGEVDDAVKVIAARLGRTPFSIQCKLEAIGVDMPELIAEKIRSGGWEAEEDSKYSGISCLPDHTVVQYTGSFDSIFNKAIIDEEKEMTKVYEEQVLVFGVIVGKAVEDQLLGLLTEISSKRDALGEIYPGTTSYFTKAFNELEKAEEAVLAQLDERFS